MKAAKKAATLTAALLATALSASQCLADYEQGDFIVRVGWGLVAPDDDSEWLRLDNTLDLPDTRVYVDDGDSATFTGTWLFADHFGLGLLVALPFEHDLDVVGLPDPDSEGRLGKVELGSIEHLPPTLTVQWFPVCKESWVQPYVGIGVNFTTFGDEEISNVAQKYFEDELGALSNADLELDDSWGLAAELGVDIMFGRDSNWLFNAAVWYLDIDTEAKIDFRSRGDYFNRITTDVDIDPWVYSVGLGYKF
ncbi:OmpW/AlkL family protein [Microbulbifer hydrolyticus]|uniref:Outer membrane beta-barrel protein n=1 Tax=Microbulbifer hydrolyticus TaxID=48074 RepID=A0A6P1T917_9GAMM|nr:OmpW family outer membrane protein [Microbulbifer hydrolyticus]MBB5211102.1 outer membrane protein [Microbulbifer hydrolyticus]QHQ38113.1 outer membrane beta-barrel protein [Microbulbifer hydrolyticus]